MNEERPGGPIRIGDREREDAVKRLGEHYEAGRLTAEEHSDRVDQVLKAKTEADLREPFADLPGPHQASTSGGTGSGGFGPGGRPWAGRGFVGRMPLPLLVLLGVLGVLASIGCVFGGGHPPILPILLIGAAVYVIRKRRTERRA
ncbi:hypothetical protein GCM10009630_13510 [Kribbella jejuensis]|uniref:Putative secreted protein with PEP-CTERM sorting signal n=1 Tax=Kribbella jejuensis TaxID=236068 RepID=A0A542E9A5_9ACTN|nr:DUF1707 domain-containing protein [Kribbella jejuensis]TQJ11910.1 putative secreted protein with PEP-CTERM sorting signal [Kribbella jejuensis]